MEEGNTAVVHSSARSRCIVECPCNQSLFCLCFLFSPPVFCAGFEGEGLFSGLLDSEEGQQAEESGNQPGAEERGVCQTGEPAQEG